MPLVALVLGTAALGSEIEDGTAVYLLAKPIPRWQVALAKIVVAILLTAALVVPSVVLTGLLVGRGGSEAIGVTLAFAFGCFVGCSAYASAFVALSAFTSRALVLGLAYVLLWEGSLGGLLKGTRFLSIRQATLGLVDAAGGQVERRAAGGGRLGRRAHGRDRRIVPAGELEARPVRGPRRRLTPLLDRFRRPG